MYCFQSCLKLFARLAKDNIGFVDWSLYLPTVSNFLYLSEFLDLFWACCFVNCEVGLAIIIEKAQKNFNPIPNSSQLFRNDFLKFYINRESDPSPGCYENYKYSYVKSCQSSPHTLSSVMFVRSAFIIQSCYIQFQFMLITALCYSHEIY